MKIVVTSPSFSKNHRLVSELKSRGFRPQINDSGHRLSGTKLFDFINDSGATAAIVGLEPVNEDLFCSCPNLKHISKYGVGLDNVDSLAIKKFGITLEWTGGVNKRSVSEQTLWFLIGHIRRLAAASYRMRNGIWEKDGGSLLSGKKIGIIGFGNVGQDLAMLLKPFECEVLFFDTLDKNKEASRLGAKEMPMREMLKNCDAISFHIPYTSKNHHIYSKKEIELSSPDLLVINTARGEVIDFKACLKAALDNKIGGLACDVFPEEPFDASQYSNTYNVYFTPHIGGNAAEAIWAMGNAAIEGLEKIRSSQNLTEKN
jgi:phosphoglycerate dehydrogenase-like enzyme